MKRNAAIFDLDGVLVDTAKYHYMAWRRLSKELGFELLPEHNEALKGVSRMRSLEILLDVGGLSYTAQEKEELAAKKNKWYVEYLIQIDENELLHGVVDTIHYLHDKGIKTAIGSASKNTALILKRTGISDLFDVVIDGTCTTIAKPDPEVFLLAARKLGIPPAKCVVFEDAIAGIAAAKAANMYTIGIGNPQKLRDADVVVPSVGALSKEQLDNLIT